MKIFYFVYYTYVFILSRYSLSFFFKYLLQYNNAALLLLLEPINISVVATQFSLYDIKDKYSLICKYLLSAHRVLNAVPEPGDAAMHYTQGFCSHEAGDGVLNRTN